MICEIKTLEATCDECGYKEMYFASRERLPRGWGGAIVHGCGMTGYSKTQDLCPACFEKAGINTPPPVERTSA